ncbi:hypothetical protein AMAG_07234 [Allomyces macrogynus ATCC 38327]|uniref:DNA polymerase delta subunit 3 n=1 Tax=Allomyces macrogynus (strain ATCC 38327) TaxID=578462 RepID=A0A0L0SI02_ALLM3|nr:hypothetical protein AMAG_07234 [Allomyces macrogynus ATCC 38327]|eukprot:KNE61970.1 hypothetical protein AMAG_07234 [Allomyces macrogynus ATCC 38327]
MSNIGSRSRWLVVQELITSRGGLMRGALDRDDRRSSRVKSSRNCNHHIHAVPTKRAAIFPHDIQQQGPVSAQYSGLIFQRGFGPFPTITTTMDSTEMIDITILHDGQPVTYKWLSRELQVTAREAQLLLAKYVEDKKAAGTAMVPLFCVTVRDDRTGNRQIALLTEAELGSLMGAPGQTIVGWHVYSDKGLLQTIDRPTFDTPSANHSLITCPGISLLARPTMLAHLLAGTTAPTFTQITTTSAPKKLAPQKPSAPASAPAPAAKTTPKVSGPARDFFGSAAARAKKGSASALASSSTENAAGPSAAASSSSAPAALTKKDAPVKPAAKPAAKPDAKPAPTKASASKPATSKSAASSSTDTSIRAAIRVTSRDGVDADDDDDFEPHRVIEKKKRIITDDDDEDDDAEMAEAAPAPPAIQDLSELFDLDLPTAEEPTAAGGEGEGQPAEPAPARRVKRKRHVKQSHTYVDDRGRFVTEDVVESEEYSEDEVVMQPPLAKMAKLAVTPPAAADEASEAAPKAPAKGKGKASKKGGGEQKSLLSFFARK